MAQVPQHTHWGFPLDPGTGCPVAGMESDFAPEELGGELPPDWNHGKHYDWQPRGDVNGQWIEDGDGRRGEVWAEAKAEREVKRGETVKVSIGSRKLTFQADAQSRELLRDAMEMARINPDYTREWRTVRNATVTLDRAGFEKVFAAIVSRNDAADDASQAARARIFDKGKPLLRSTGAVMNEVMK